LKVRFTIEQLEALKSANKIRGYTECPKNGESEKLPIPIASDKKRGNKYNAKKVEIDGIRFDSKKEGRRYVELKAEQMAGKIRGLQVHFPFDLIAEGELIAVYEADFVYFLVENGEMVVEDVKGAATRKLGVYRLKKKLMKVLNNIEIQEI
jgi:hypothetical protein